LPSPADEFLVTSMPVLVSEVRIPYPEEAKKAGIEGPVVMDLLIDEQGKVRQVSLIKGPGFGLNDAALAAIKSFLFRPARIKDQSVAVKIRYTYRFVLENR
jgi:protein TonB